MLEILEFTDPACPWAWGSEPVLQWLRRATGPAQAAGQVRWRRVYGILFDVDDDPAPDPAAETAHYARWLAGVSGHTGAPYPHTLQWVTATSWPASLAARAAERQGADVAERVLRRLRETTFVDGTPADTPEAVRAVLASVPGLDLARLEADLKDPAVRESVQDDWTLTRRPDPSVVGLTDDSRPHPGAAKQSSGGLRYALPTVVLRGSGGQAIVPGWRTRDEYVTALAAAEPGLELANVRCTADELVRELGSVTAAELGLLTGAQTPPLRASHVKTHNGGVWRFI